MDTKLTEPIAPEPYGGPLSIYVHVPFCQVKCPYCDFNTYAGIEALIGPYINAIATEINLWGEILEIPVVKTFFLGGGTPSYLPTEALTTLISSLKGAFDTIGCPEITIEANPDDLNEQTVETFMELGINRLSIGFQSLEDRMLEKLGRSHDSAQALNGFLSARKAGMDNVSIDLMYGLPGQTLVGWQETLQRVIDLEADHLSLYALGIEQGTPLAADVKAGNISEIDPDLSAEMYEIARDLLGIAGFAHYEISNWAKPGRASNHNLTYWTNGPYLGVGPGAHSSLKKVRFSNIKSPRSYIANMKKPTSINKCSSFLERLENCGAIDQIEHGSLKLEMSDTMILGLRLAGGVSVQRFTERFTVDPRKIYRNEIRQLAAIGLINVRQDSIRIPQDSWMISNEVFSRFVTTECTD